ncbi:MAG: prepilin-type N-terminal cleavage/methylation domain-containing protein [Candidatus Paceibacterota bacterium]
MKNQGFSLLEIIITLAVAILIMTIGTINLVGFSAEKKLGDETEKLSAMLRLAQEKSLNRENNARFGVSLVNHPSGSDQLVLFQVDEAELVNSSYAVLPGETIETYSLISPITLLTPDESQRENILFEIGTGRASASSTVVLARENATSSQKSIYIYTNGRIEESE